MHHKADDTFRIWANNINGISLANDGAQIHDLCIALSDYHIDCIALQETNLDWTQQSTRDQVLQIFKEHFGMVQLTTSTSAITFDKNSPWKPGGVALILLGKWASVGSRSSTDSMGRWASITISSDKNHQVTIYSIYNVVDTNITHAGPYTVFAQQYATLRAAGIRNPDPKRQFIQDLNQELNKRTRNNEQLILLGDLNESVGQHPHLFSSVCSRHDLYDVHDFHLGDDADIPTYCRGTKKLDYCFMSSTLQPCYSSCGFNLFHEIFYSDHRAHYLDLNLDCFLGKTPPTMAPPSRRSISSKSQDVILFVSTLYQHFTDTGGHKLMHQFNEQSSSLPEPWILANKIDSLLGQAIDKAFRICSKPRRPPWSDTLHLASMKVRYWQIYLSSLTTNAQHNSVLAELSPKIWPTNPPHHPASIRNTKSILRAARRNLRTARRNAYATRKLFLEKQRSLLASRFSSANPEKAMLQVIRQLRDKQMFQRIKRALKPVQQQALTRVEIVQKTAHLHPETGEPVLRES